MKQTQLKFLVLALSLGATALTHADHNSIWGEGTANMPNDIHNTRIDTMDDDTDSFIDFVRMGSGADSDNRFSSDTVSTDGGSGSTAGSTSLNQGGSRGGRS